MEFLQSNIFDTGTIFTISDKVKNSSHIPGSMGFIAFSSGLDDSYQNVANISVILIRKGKTGKERLEFCRLKTPIFVVDDENFAKILPTTESRRNFVHINKETDQYINLMDANSLYFIGWAVAMANKLKLMSSKCKHGKWPNSNKNPISKMLRLPDYFLEDPTTNLEFYSNLETRISFLNEARSLYYSMVKIHLDLDEAKVKCEINAAEFLEYTNKGKFLEKKNAKNEYKFTKDDAMLERTIKYYKNVEKDINKLRSIKSKSK